MQGWWFIQLLELPVRKLTDAPPGPEQGRGAPPGCCPGLASQLWMLPLPLFHRAAICGYKLEVISLLSPPQKGKNKVLSRKVFLKV